MCCHVLQQILHFGTEYQEYTRAYCATPELKSRVLHNYYDYCKTRNSSGDEIANVLSLRRHHTRTTKYNRLVHKFHNRSTRSCVGRQVYKIQWNNAM